ncbi:hypothetical protein pipiens_002476 [Culex pipiens pipiens]|uniref:Uncharacterized protein n=1 Tax=Culex pipiens pipiens TaxID=38569 RepID=A0ABD1DDP4_CULPP
MSGQQAVYGALGESKDSSPRCADAASERNINKNGRVSGPVLATKSLPTELYHDEPAEGKTGGDRSTVGTVSCAFEGFLFQRFETGRFFTAQAPIVPETVAVAPNSGGGSRLSFLVKDSATLFNMPDAADKG